MSHGVCSTERSPVAGEYYRSDYYDENGQYPVANEEGLGLDELFEDDSSARRTVEVLNADTRLMTRMLCSPSGELPTAPFPTFSLGQDFSGRPSPGLAVGPPPCAARLRRFCSWIG